MRTVLCHGVFDLLHRGHVVHLKEARAFGDWLVVSVVADKHVWKPNRPMVFNQIERMAVLEALRCVDEVILCNAPGPEMVITELRPDVYVRGPDYKGKPMPEEEVLLRFGIPVRYTESDFPRTTEIIERIRR